MSVLGHLVHCDTEDLVVTRGWHGTSNVSKRNSFVHDLEEVSGKRKSVCEAWFERLLPHLRLGLVCQKGSVCQVVTTELGT